MSEVSSRINDLATVRREYASEGRFLARRLANQATLRGPIVEDEAIRAVAERAPHRVLDIGCGTGDFSERLQRETGAEVIGLDWRIPLDEGWRSLGSSVAVQGNLDPVLLFAEWKELQSRAADILRRAGGRPGHIFNLGHGILPETPVENVKALAKFVQGYSAGAAASR